MIGERFGLPIPADPDALRAAGAEFLTYAFRIFGVLPDGNVVTRITQFDEVPGGSTGRKLLLSVEYEKPDMYNHMFVKFSRDLRDPIRDIGKTQMESEVRFAVLSLTPEFPIAVPRPLFADYHRTTGTGILISERIPFGINGIEKQYHKCIDYEMPEPLEHYRALLTALARLAGYHRSGRLPVRLTEQFPIDLQGATVGDRTPIRPETLHRRLTRLVEFVQTHPALFPANVRAPSFFARLHDETPRFLRREPEIWRYLAHDPDYLALCHWNANVDNAWFWRDSANTLHCGLMDWGCVSQLNVTMSLWGALSGAETAMWDRHLDELLDLFVTEVRRCGGPILDPGELTRQLMGYVAVMGITWLLGVPALIHNRFGTSTQELSRTDPRIKNDESVRAPLQMLTNVLNLWETYPFGDLLDEALAHR